MSNLKDVRQTVIEITLDRVRHIKFDLNAYAEMEDKFGSIDEAMNMLSDGKLKALRFILWAGLIHEDETLTEKQVGSLIGNAQLVSVMEAISKGLVEAMPDTTSNEYLGNQQSQ